MNKARRAKLNSIINAVSELRDETESIKDDEQDAMDNMPESLQGSAMYEQMENAIDNLESADDCFADLINYLEDAMG